MAAAFEKMAVESAVSQTEETPHGRKYVIVGKVAAPGGKPARVQTIWIVDQGLTVPRLVTAYPFEE